jgi:hypothetical protein
MNGNAEIFGNGKGNHWARFSAQYILYASDWQASITFKGRNAFVALAQRRFDIFGMRRSEHV